MTRDEIVNASPSQLNEWVDKRIMSHREPWLPPADWSGSIDAAWEVVEKMKTDGLRSHVNVASEKSGGVIRGIAKAGDWHCNILQGENKGNHVYAKTAPEAICKAALLACLEGET